MSNFNKFNNEESEEEQCPDRGPHLIVVDYIGLDQYTKAANLKENFNIVYNILQGPSGIEAYEPEVFKTQIATYICQKLSPNVVLVEGSGTIFKCNSVFDLMTLGQRFCEVEREDWLQILAKHADVQLAKRFFISGTEPVQSLWALEGEKCIW